MLDLDGRGVMISGDHRRIGLRIAVQLVGDGVRVTNVFPGFVATDMTLSPEADLDMTTPTTLIDHLEAPS